MDREFAGKVVLVTGGSRGMGREIVHAFAERGADVVVASRKLDNCEAVAAATDAHRRGQPESAEQWLGRAVQGDLGYRIKNGERVSTTSPCQDSSAPNPRLDQWFT